MFDQLSVHRRLDRLVFTLAGFQVHSLTLTSPAVHRGTVVLKNLVRAWKVGFKLHVLELRIRVNTVGTLYQSEVTKVSTAYVCKLTKITSDFFFGPQPDLTRDDMLRHMLSFTCWLSRWCPENNVICIDDWCLIGLWLLIGTCMFFSSSIFVIASLPLMSYFLIALLTVVLSGEFSMLAVELCSSSRVTKGLLASGKTLSDVDLKLKTHLLTVNCS